MLEAFAQDLRRGTPADLLRAARRAQLAAFLVLALPGLPLGGLYLLTRPDPLPWPWVAALVGLAALLAWVPLRLARRAALAPGTPPTRRALTAALQAGSAPAVPFLLGCTFFAQPAALALLWLLAAAAFLAARAGLPRWASMATAAA